MTWREQVLKIAADRGVTLKQIEDRGGLTRNIAHAILKKRSNGCEDVTLAAFARALNIRFEVGPNGTTVIQEPQTGSTGGAPAAST